MAMGMHSKTPRLIVVDPRSLPIRSVDYWRAVENQPTEARINRTVHDGAGRAIKHWDPRLWALQVDYPLARANLATVYSLSGNALRTTSVDAGTQINLHGLADEVLWGRDSRETRREVEYDDSLRVVAVFEQGASEPRHCVERFTYGFPGQGDPTCNQYSQLIRNDHPAGSVLFNTFAISGQCTEDTRHFTHDPITPDWPESIDDRQRLLEPGAGATSRWRFGPLGNVLEQTDAKGNRQAFGLTVDGRLHESRLQLKDQPTGQTLVSEIRYNAQGQVEGDVAGNGVRTTLAYRPEDGRLICRRAEDASARMLQHLIYDYDQMGNVLSIEDKALPVRYFANQRIDPISRFSYDSLSQLIEAFAWEAGGPNQGPNSIGRIDPSAVSNYRQTYCYDAGGNLLKLTHVGAQNPGRDLQAACYSNRCLPWRNGVPPTEEEIAAAFDAKGNLLELDQGRFLSWDLRNQLQSVSPVERASGLDDCEMYLYDGAGQRVRKIRSLQTRARTVVAEVRYLPGLELRTNSGTGERLQVITVEGGLNGVRVLRWESPPPSGANDQYRYSLTDHLRSVSLELTADAQIISRQSFYPFGEAAWQEGELGNKTVHYSDKERDATGLYYYGYRYYIPWLQRWANPDPAGLIDGLNVYAMVANNPITFSDANGLEKTGKYEIEVGMKNWLKFKAAALTSKIGVFKQETGKYKDVNDFEVVEVGAFSDYLVTGDEVKETLRNYKQRYKKLASEESKPRVAGQPSNFALGENISSYMLRSANDAFVDDSGNINPENRHPDFVVERRFFAVMNKSDKYKLPEERQIYGLAELNTFTEKGKTEVDVVQVVVHPGTQDGGKLKSKDSAESNSLAQLPLLRGVGTYLTVHSVKAVSKGADVKKIKTDAVNPRSARIAKKFDAKLVVNR